jgi:transposase
MVGEGDKARIIGHIIPRANAKHRCSGCGEQRPRYDSMRQPRAFIPSWKIPRLALLHDAPRSRKRGL